MSDIITKRDDPRVGRWRTRAFIKFTEALEMGDAITTSLDAALEREERLRQALQRIQGGCGAPIAVAREALEGK